MARCITHGRDVGEIRTCNRTENFTTGKTMRGSTGRWKGLEWMSNLPTNWTGSCALVQLGMPFILTQSQVEERERLLRQDLLTLALELQGGYLVSSGLESSIFW
jgi:hypothetical protein